MSSTGTMPSRIKKLQPIGAILLTLGFYPLMLLWMIIGFFTTLPLFLITKLATGGSSSLDRWTLKLRLMANTVPTVASSATSTSASVARAVRFMEVN